MMGWRVGYVAYWDPDGTDVTGIGGGLLKCQDTVRLACQASLLYLSACDVGPAYIGWPGADHIENNVRTMSCQCCLDWFLLDAHKAHGEQLMSAHSAAYTYCMQIRLHVTYALMFMCRLAGVHLCGSAGTARGSSCPAAG